MDLKTSQSQERSPSSELEGERCYENTDRELWRREGSDPSDPDNYYQPSIHVTKEGAIGINVGGYVYVKPIEEWHRLAGGKIQGEAAMTTPPSELATHYALRAQLPDRIWVGKDAIGGLMIYPRMPDHRQAAQYMRVLSRSEVEELAQSLDGVDPMQLINSLQRTIEGQRKHIARLKEKP